MQIQIDVNKDQFKSLMLALGNAQNQLPRHLRAAVNKTAKTVRVQVAKALGKVMHLKSNFDSNFKKAATLKKVIKAKSMAKLETPVAVLQLSEGYPFPLKYYDAKPVTKKRKGKKVYEGVSYRYQPAKASAEWGRKRIAVDAFIVTRYGNNVYSRDGSTKSRLVKVVGPSPGDYYDAIGASAIAKRVAEDRLPKEIKRRIRAIMLENQGIIKLRTSRGSA